MTGRQLRDPREQVQERILGPEDDARAKDRPVELRHLDDRLGRALGAQITAGTGGIGIERAHLHQPANARGGAGGGQVPRKLDVHARERIAPGFVQDADEDSRRRLHPTAAGRAPPCRTRSPRRPRRSAGGSGASPVRGGASGTTTACPAADSRATRWRPTKPLPPRTTMRAAATVTPFVRLWVRRPRRRAARRRRGARSASAGGPPNALCVHHRIREHFLHVVAGFVERDRLDPHRRLRAAPRDATPARVRAPHYTQRPPAPACDRGRSSQYLK